MKKINRKKGFTLVELIIAMAILVIAAGGIGLSVEVASSMYSQNTNDLKSTEYTDKILEYFKGKGLISLSSMYDNSTKINGEDTSKASTTKYLYIYFNNDDASDETAESLNYILTNKNASALTMTDEGINGVPSYADCSSNNTSNYKYGAIVTLTKNYDYDSNDNSSEAAAAQSYNFYTYKIDVTLYNFEMGQNIQSELNVLVSR